MSTAFLPDGGSAIPPLDPLPEKRAPIPYTQKNWARMAIDSDFFRYFMGLGSVCGKMSLAGQRWFCIALAYMKVKEYRGTPKTTALQGLGEGAMTPAELRQFREKWGLTAEAMATMLGYRGAQRRQVQYDLETGRRPIREPQRRLLAAYQHGYRPDDWPKVRRRRSSSA